MFTTIMLDSPINENDTDLLIKDLLEEFNKTLKLKDAEKSIINQQSTDLYFLKDKIEWFNQNNIIHPDLSTLQSRIGYLIDLLEKCGPHAKNIIAQEEIETIFNKHANTINYYFPGKIKNDTIKKVKDAEKTKHQAIKLSQDNIISRILYQYNDAIYCATMLDGLEGESGKNRASRGLEDFQKSLADAAKNGLSKDETTYLLEQTILMKPKAFLVALSYCNDFTLFSALLDRLEPKMAALANPHVENITSGLSLFSLMMTADTRGCPKAADFERYKQMRTTMLAKSNTPNDAVIRDVVTQFENQFTESVNLDHGNVECKLQ
jgi:hypothetical protein